MRKRNSSGHPQGVECWEMDVGISAVNTEVDTGHDLPPTGILVGYALDVITAEVTGTTKTMDIGTLTGETGADPDGLFDAVDCSATGLKLPSLASGAQTRGALMREDEGGGVLIPKHYDVASVAAKSISRTLGSNNWAEFEGRLLLWIQPIPSRGLT